MAGMCERLGWTDGCGKGDRPAPQAEGFSPDIVVRGKEQPLSAWVRVRLRQKKPVVSAV
jgi:hypothetical protein